MKIPVLCSVDTLIIGGTLPAVSFARRMRTSGASVCIATPWSYLGEELCATQNFQSPKSEAYAELTGTAEMLPPRAIKAAADQAAVDAGISLFFQLKPIAPLRGENGQICGAVFAHRGGFHAVRARVILDVTTRATFARSAGVPFPAFMPEEVKFTAHVIGSVSDHNGEFCVTRCPQDMTDGEKTFPLHRVEGRVHLPAASAIEVGRVVSRLRLQMWHYDSVAVPDEIEFAWNDAAPAEGYAPSALSPVFVGVPAPAAVQELLAQCASAKETRCDTSRISGTESILASNALPRPLQVLQKETLPGPAATEWVDFDEQSFPPIALYDVLVVGGGTGGAPAAIGAARAGARTLCVENLAILGGLMTAGRIGKYWFGRQVGFTHENDTALYKMGPDNPNNDGGWAYNGDWRAALFLQQASEAGADIISQAYAVAALMAPDGATVCGSVVATPFGAGIVYAGVTVDASGNGDIAYKAGAQTIDTLAQEPAIQGAGVSPIQLGCSYSNNDFTFVIDSDFQDATRAFLASRAKHNTAFDTASILGTRERRRILGDIVLHPVDFFAGRTYKDTICVAASNFDTHGYTLSSLFLIEPPPEDRREADIPLRALTPKGLENILVTGLSVSADRDAMPLIRMQADVMNQGFAAGLLAATAALSRTTVRALPLRPVQEKLVALDILPARVLTDREETPAPGENDDIHVRTARYLADPEFALPRLRARLAEQPDDLKAAQMLAFLGDDSGRATLLTSVAQPWDEGWNYRGMGQFGRCVSPIDTSLFALSKIGGGEAAVLEKLSTLRLADHFSHTRAVCMFLIAHPDPEAVPDLMRLLSSPGAQGHAITSQKMARSSFREAYNDTAERNDQLREVYLARALHACAPDNPTALHILESYRATSQKVYVPFASQES